jgi:hypothetical protein
MSDDFEADRYPSAEELLKALQERADDFEKLTIQVPNELLLTGPRGQRKIAPNICGGIKMCSGKTLFIHREDMEILLNNGILQRLKIPVVLSPP